MSAFNYTPEQLERRNNSIWTPVQAILAPLQLLTFIISLGLIINYLTTGNGYEIATASVLLKIGLMWLITITGMLWEKEVYGKWFMAPEFFWEDLFNAIALFTHNLYFVARGFDWSDRALLMLMLFAYLTYTINFMQFLIKGLKARNQRISERNAQAIIVEQGA